MKKLLLPILLALFLSSQATTASEYPVIDNQVENRQKQLEWILMLQEISMKAVVDYIDEISDGRGVSELEDILSEFSSMVDGMGSYSTHIGLNNFLRELKEVTTSFRTETRSQMSAHNGKPLLLLARIAEKIDENSDQLDALKNQYWETRKENVMENFDIRVERAQTVLDALDERGYDISEAQDKLDQIRALRDDLEETLLERDNLGILGVSINALELSKELAKIVRDLQVEIPMERIVRHWMNVGERIVDRTRMIIDELERLGLETEELEGINGEAESHLADAGRKLEDEDIEGAVEALHRLKDDIMKLRDAYMDLVFPDDTPEEIEDNLELLNERLEETAKHMEKSLDTS